MTEDIMYLGQMSNSDNLYFNKKIRLLISNYFTKYYRIAAEPLQNCHGHVVLDFILGYLTVSNVNMAPTQKREMRFVMLNSIGESIVKYKASKMLAVNIIFI